MENLVSMVIMDCLCICCSCIVTGITAMKVGDVYLCLPFSRRMSYLLATKVVNWGRVPHFGIWFSDQKKKKRLQS